MTVVIKTTAVVLKGLGVPKYSSERSNHLYDEHVKIGLLILRQYFSCSYEELCERLVSMKNVMEVCGIRRVPDPSTLRKFVKRLNPEVLELVLGSLASFVCNQEMTVAVDATGFSCSNASRHFVKRMKQMGSYIASIRDYVKTSLVIDTETLTVLACESTISNVHDIKHIPKLIDMLVRNNYDISYVLADKGYDSEHIHETIRARLGADAVIPVRKYGNAFKGRIPKAPRGKNRKVMFHDFPKEKYNRRCLVETVNSMIKRKMGDTVYGKTEHSMCMEVLFRCIAHNFRRLFKLGAI